MMNRFKLALAATLTFLFMPLAGAEESLALSASLDNGGCFDAYGEVYPTYELALDYRRDEPGLEAHGYARSAPTGGDCTVDGLSIDVGVTRRWDISDSPWFLAVALGVDQHAVVQPYSLDGLGAVWRYEVDGAPAYVGAIGLGRRFGENLTIRLTGNVVETDWSDGSSKRGIRAAIGYETSLPWIAGDLDLSFDTEMFRRNSFRAAWSRDFEDSPFGVRVTYRVEDGLDELASPFAAAIVRDGDNYLIGPASPRVHGVTFGLSYSW